MATITGTNGNDMLNGTGGNDTLRGLAGNDTLIGLGGNDVLVGGAGADQLFGSGGFDTASYATSTAGVHVSLLDATAASGEAQGDMLFGMEGVIGSASNDTLTGDDFANRLEGGGGSDVLAGDTGDDLLAGGPGGDHIDGGDGIDTADYSSSQQGVLVSLDPETRLALRGDAEGDNLTGIENLTGSVSSDLLGGDDGTNVVHGGGGGDLLAGFDGDDRLFGDAGNDDIRGGAGADHLEGGAGSDTLDYAGADAAVSVNLATGIVLGGDAQGDTVAGFESAAGSDLNDTLIGNSGANTLAGRAGADMLQGGAGVDTLDYLNSFAGVSVDLTSGETSGGDAEGDRISGFENIRGSLHNDGLIGDDGANALFGDDGDDFLFGLHGRDELTGGKGADRFFFQDKGSSGATAATRDVVHDFHQAEHDILDLGQIDGSTGHAGKQDLTFIGKHAFTAEDQVRYFFEGSHTVVEVNTTGSSGADLQIQLDGHVNLAAHDFFLLTEV